MSDIVALQSVVLACGTIAFVASLQFLRRFLDVRRERPGPAPIDGTEERLARIELIVEATAIEVERISEAHRFMAKLLSDRGEAANPASRPERVITPH